MNMKHLYTSLSSGETSGSVTDNSIQNDSVIEIYYDNDNCYTESISQNGHSIYFNVGGNTVGTNICVVVNNLTNFTPYDDTNVQTHLQDLDGDIADINGHIEIVEGYIDNITEDIETINTTLTSHSDEIDNIQSNKQDKLTAGNNITIDEDNVISAIGGGGSSDIYLEDTEIVVGSFYGKPIYRYCHTFPVGTGGIGSSTTLIPDIPNFDYSVLDEVLKVEMHLYGSNYGDNLLMNGPCRKYSGKIGIYKWADYFSSTTGRIFRYVVEYTKVGD